jgi:hypothetical protein
MKLLAFSEHFQIGTDLGHNIKIRKRNLINDIHPCVCKILQVILGSMMSSHKHPKYPPADITTIDGTNVEDPNSLDHFFMDNDIIDFIRTEFAESDLTSDFFETYPVLSRQLWAGQHYPEFARSIGFP